MRNRIPKADNSQKQPLPWLLRTPQKDPATKLWHICWGPSKSHADSLVDSSVSLSRLEPKFIDSGYHLWVPLMPLDPTIFPPTLPQDSQTQPNAGLWVTASVLISYWMKPLMKLGKVSIYEYNRVTLGIISMTSFLVMLESILDLGAIQTWVMVVQAVSGVALSSYMDLKLDTFFCCLLPQFLCHPYPSKYCRQGKL